MMSKGATSQNEVASSSDATASGGGPSSPTPTHTSTGGRSYRRGRGKKAVDGFPVPADFRREGAREASFMYSIGVYVETIEEKTASC